MATECQNFAVLDIETNLAHDTIWMAGVYLPATGESIACVSPDELRAALRNVTTIVGHNLIDFDLPVLEDVWGWKWKAWTRDTIVMSRLYDPSIEGGHSLKAWAKRVNKNLKLDFEVEDFDAGLTDEMKEYCLADCRATWDLFVWLQAALKDAKFSDESIRLEHLVRKHTTKQTRNGFIGQPRPTSVSRTRLRSLTPDQGSKLRNDLRLRVRYGRSSLRRVNLKLMKRPWKQTLISWRRSWSLST